VYHDLLTQRSEFFRAARSQRWSDDPTKPTTLDDVEVEVFSAYLHCVNFGAEALNSLVQAMMEDHPEYLKELKDNGDSGSNDNGKDNDDKSVAIRVSRWRLTTLLPVLQKLIEWTRVALRGRRGRLRISRGWKWISS
jgi:hypothetical protein